MRWASSTKSICCVPVSIKSTKQFDAFDAMVLEFINTEAKLPHHLLLKIHSNSRERRLTRFPPSLAMLIMIH